MYTLTLQTIYKLYYPYCKIMHHFYILLLFAFRERTTQEEEQINRISDKVQKGFAALEEKTANVRQLERNLVDLKAKQDRKVKNFKEEIRRTNAETEKTKNKIERLTRKINKYNEAMDKIKSKY